MATSHAQDIARDSARVDQFETWLGSYQEVSHDQHIYIYVCICAKHVFLDWIVRNLSYLVCTTMYIYI